MKGRTAILCAALAAAAPSAGIAANWLELDKNPSVYLDTDSISWTGSTAQAHIKYAGGLEPPIAYAVLTIELDCAKRTFRMADIRGFDAADKDLGLETLSKPMAPILPGSNGERIHQKICPNQSP